MQGTTEEESKYFEARGVSLSEQFEALFGRWDNDRLQGERKLLPYELGLWLAHRQILKLRCETDRPIYAARSKKLRQDVIAAVRTVQPPRVRAVKSEFPGMRALVDEAGRRGGFISFSGPGKTQPGRPEGEDQEREQMRAFATAEYTRLHPLVRSARRAKTRAERAKALQALGSDAPLLKRGLATLANATPAKLTRRIIASKVRDRFGVALGDEAIRRLLREKGAKTTP
jgi:hypothetical protein